MVQDNKIKDGLDITYLLGQPEKGRKHNYEHWQVFVQFAVPKRMHQVKAIFGNVAHCEKREGSVQSNLVYCKKTETRIGQGFELGAVNMHEKGANQYAALHAAIKDQGKSIEEVLLDQDLFPAFARAERAARALSAVVEARKPAVAHKPICVLLWGDSGTGKSRTARSIRDMDYGGIAYNKSSTKWWCNYAQQEMVLVDDMIGDSTKESEGSCVSLATLLRIMDWECSSVMLETKGGCTYLRGVKIIVFTSNVPLRCWYRGILPAQQQALLRRFDHIFHYDASGAITCQTQGKSPDDQNELAWVNKYVTW